MTMLFAPHIVDCHTHTPDKRDAVISVAPGTPHTAGCSYSVGIHPWDSADVTPEMLDLLDREAALPEVVAIGETGLDALRGASMADQETLFMHHVALSERLCKPLVIHAVRSLHHILRLRKSSRAVQPWIIHGFRGNAETGRQLIAAGMYLSLGERHADLSGLPADRLLHETD